MQEMRTVSPVTERLQCSIDRTTSGLTISGTLDEKDNREKGGEPEKIAQTSDLDLRLVDVSHSTAAAAVALLV